MKILRVEDEAVYPSLIMKFKTDLRKFYKCGKYTFLTKRNYGDDESFFHCLRFYIPNIVDVTWESLSLELEFSQCKAMKEEIKNQKIL